MEDNIFNVLLVIFFIGWGIILAIKENSAGREQSSWAHVYGILSTVTMIVAAVVIAKLRR